MSIKIDDSIGWRVHGFYSNDITLTMTTPSSPNNIRSEHIQSMTHKPIRSNPVCVGLTSGAQLSIVDRLIEFKTRDNRITCMIQFKTSSADPTVKYPPTELQMQFVRECRSFFLTLAFSELEETREKDLLPKLISTPSDTVRVVCTVVIPFILHPEDDSNLTRVAGTLEPSDLYHDATAYCADGYELCIRLHISHAGIEPVRTDLVDDLINKHVVFFWTKTKKQIMSDYLDGLIPEFPIGAEFGLAAIGYRLVVIDSVPWPTHLDLHEGGSW